VYLEKMRVTQDEKESRSCRLRFFERERYSSYRIV